MEIKPIPFEVNRVQKGEYRVYLNLTTLGEKAFEVLKFAESLGFDKPQFVTDRGWVLAILFREFHNFEDDPEVLFAHLHDKNEELWEACEPDAHLKVSISHRFKQKSEAAIS